jgi:hypothetical protein
MRRNVCAALDVAAANSHHRRFPALARATVSWVVTRTRIDFTASGDKAVSGRPSM